MLRMPYQSLLRCGSTLVAATTSHLDTFDYTTGSVISRWSCPVSSILHTTNSAEAVELSSTTQEKSESPFQDIAIDAEPPSKKRRLSDSGEPGKPQGNGKAKAPRPRPSTKSSKASPSAANIIALTSTQDARHVIVVTAEDKTIRVFKSEDGILNQISARTMPKRPCAIALVSDESTILCADKFGDVYSLPLIPSEESKSELEDESASTSSTVVAEDKPFISAANNLTIHTARNRRALENQLRQRKRQTDKDEPKFEHQLLLGHVSMLTDLVALRRGGREYIVTADRDEHIRISRGIPQSHIIENYCLGHKDFVSRLCFPTALPDLLISGGGEGDIYVWKWQSGEKVGTFSLNSFVADVLPPLPVANEAAIKITVSSLKDFGTLGDGANVIACCCEGVPGLLLMKLDAEGNLSHLQTLKVDGNVLDVETDLSTGDIVVSVDLVHVPGSTTELRAKSLGNESNTSLMTFSQHGSQWSKSAKTFEAAKSEGVENEDFGSLSGVLYNLENLRKREVEELKDAEE